MQTLSLAIVTTLAALCFQPPCLAADPPRPNILFVIFDDLSARHVGAYGDKAVKTPAVDRIAHEGVRFSRAFCASPSCTPSRAAILTGQAMWRLEEAGLLMGAFPSKLKVTPWLLADSGYFVGYTGKGWAPGNWKSLGRTTDPAGREYNKIHNHRDEKLGPDKKLPPYWSIDYAENFAQFLKEKPKDQPFYFWCGFCEPHLPWPEGAGKKAGKSLSDANIPLSAPDHPVVRGDVLDYYTEIEWADSHLGKIVKTLEAAGELDNTLIIVTSDNGIALPRDKCNLYDGGTHMPLVVRYPKLIKGERVVEDVVSVPDVAPTILEAAGLKPLAEMTARSLMPLLASDKSGRIDLARDAAYFGLERHTWTREDGLGYPMRAIRTEKYLYIRNYQPDRWPMGDPDFNADPQSFFGDIDWSPTKKLLLDNRNDPKIGPYFQLATCKRPAEELYDVTADTDQMKNLADEPAFANTKEELKSRLDKYLAETADPRAKGQAPWDHYPYYYKDFWKRAKKQSQ